MPPTITVAPFALHSLSTRYPAWQFPVLIPMPTMSPVLTMLGSNREIDSSTSVGSPTKSTGVAIAITNSHLGVMMLYPIVELAGLTRTTFVIYPLLRDTISFFRYKKGGSNLIHSIRELREPLMLRKLSVYVP